MRIFECLGPSGWGTYAWDGESLIPTSQRSEGVATPGLYDIHFHGAFGVDFMSATAADLRRLCARLRDEAYAGVLLTTVTAPPEDVLRALSHLPDDPLIRGVHLEGPFISPSYPGAQPPSAIRDPEGRDPAWDQVFNHPQLRLVTLAPERPGALALIRELAARGVAVSFGHTNATYAEARAGFLAGGRNATHTFNAMRPLHHREAGAVGFVMGEPGMRAELIYDRLHVCHEAAHILVKAKGPESIVAVSDSTMATGQLAGTELRMWGLEVTVGEDDVRLKGTDTLAGSAVSLKQVFQNLCQDFGPEVAARAACYNPRRVVEPECAASLEWLWDRDGNLIGPVQ